MLKIGIVKKIVKLVNGVYRYNIKSRYQRLNPRSLMINLTYLCNSRCVMCNIWKMKPKNELTYDDWVEVMKESIFKDIRNLTISGGEPLLFKDYVKSVKLFIDSMPRLKQLMINSNGFMTNKLVADMKEISKYCQQKGILLGANISIDGVADVHDSIRRIKNGFDKSAATVVRYKKLAKKYGFNVTVSSLLLRQNIDRYQEFVEWLKKTKTQGSFQIVGFHKTFLNNKETEKDLNINSKVIGIFLKVLKAIRNSKDTDDISRYYWEDMINMYENGGVRMTPCSFLYDDFVIDSLGDVYYCLSVKPIGNFVKEKRSIVEIYNDPKNIEFRKNLSITACKKCNSGCDVRNAIIFDFKHYIKFKLTGKL